MFIISKINNFLKKHHIGVCIALLLPIYHWLVVNQAQIFGVNYITYAFFAVDYSMGFCDKFFIGELFNLFVGEYTYVAASIFTGVFYAAFILLIAFLGEKFFSRFQRNRQAGLVYACFFLLGPFSFNIFIKQFGMLDFFWAFFFFLAVVCLNHKYLKFFVPILSVMMILIHYGSIICYVAALLLIIVFYILKSDSKKEKKSFIIIFSFTAILTICFTIYFIKNNTGNLIYSVEQFRHIVQDQRGAYSSYYDMTFYKELPKEVSASPFFQIAYKKGFVGEEARSLNSFLKDLFTRIKATAMINSLKQIMFCIIGSIIPWSFLFYILKGYLKENTSRKMKALSVFFVLLCVFLEIIGCILSTDTPRWTAQSIILMFTFVSLILHFEYQNGIERIEKLLLKTGYSFVYVFLFFYSNIILDPFTFIFS